MTETPPSSGPSRDLLLPVSILIAGVLISGSIVYMVGSKNNAPSEGGEVNAAAAILKVLPEDVVLGDAKAPVTLIEYGDYQCLFCGRFFSDIEPGIRDEYVRAGKVKIIFRNFQFLGPESAAAGLAAECAREQGQFWGYHDALYRAEIADGKEHNGNLNKDLFLRLAKELKLDEKKFTSCLDSGKYLDHVEEETNGGRTAGVDATPTNFVNETKIRGLAPGDTRVVEAIEAALKGQ
ncbi:MAG: hypothetical protein FJY98_00320 [Candidatus Liptonbacteria bacterium]|nr:hypothetical protein [Candidatus Liptonbacteria bacterium]